MTMNDGDSEGGNHDADNDEHDVLAEGGGSDT